MKRNYGDRGAGRFGLKVVTIIQNFSSFCKPQKEQQAYLGDSGRKWSGTFRTGGTEKRSYQTLQKFL
jgi:hypothetical protein